METEACYRCDSCQYLYKTAEHRGVAPEDQKPGWICPVCGAEADHFQLEVPSDVIEERGVEEDSIDVSDQLQAGRRLASIKNTTPEVASLLKRWRRGDLALQPKFQRYEVWSQKTKSLLIESILLELPIPTIYFAEDPTGKFVVVDGQQRLSAIFNFHDNKYALAGLKALEAYNGKYFRDLDGTLQARIEDRALDVTEIYKETDENVRFSLFERLNRGSVRLNDQELRNCVYRGEYNDFVKRLAANPILAQCLGLKKGEPHPRMVDAELVLRFLAFYEQGFAKHPDKKTGEFLNRQMELGCKGVYSERDLQKQEQAFNDALQCARSIYGGYAFRRFQPGTKSDPNGKWEPRINRALMDVVLNTLARHPKNKIMRVADALRERTLELMCDAEFTDVIKHTISSSARVRRRFQMFEEAIRDLLEDSTGTGRLFRQSEKESLFRTDPTCRICHNRIMLLEDAHVDHLVPYVSGGRTTMANAQLAHRYCNIAAGAKKSRGRKAPHKSRARRKTVRAR